MLTGWVGTHQTDPDSNNLDVAMQGRVGIMATDPDTCIMKLHKAKSCIDLQRLSKKHPLS
jgi:hypothetical protein